LFLFHLAIFGSSPLSAIVLDLFLLLVVLRGCYRALIEPSIGRLEIEIRGRDFDIPSFDVPVPSAPSSTSLLLINPEITQSAFHSLHGLPCRVHGTISPVVASALLVRVDFWQLGLLLLELGLLLLLLLRDGLLLSGRELLLLLWRDLTILRTRNAIRGELLWLYRR
jgi:hypothetical protein